MCALPGGDGIGLVEPRRRATGVQSRSTSGSPKTVCAQPSFGKATIVQLTSRSFCAA